MPTTLITTTPGKEKAVIEDVLDCLYRLDESVRLEATRFPGLVKLHSSMPSEETSRIISSYWIRHIKRIIPLDEIVEASLPKIVETVVKLVKEKVTEKETIAVKCFKRGDRLKSGKQVEVEVGAALTNLLRLKVDLINPDVTVEIEVLDDEAGISIAKKEEGDRVERVWPPRLSREG